MVLLAFWLVSLTPRKLESTASAYTVLQSVALFVLQAIAGFVIGRAPGQKLLGVNKAKSLWKWHRASGELTVDRP